jgi:hypothetical protein
MSVLYCGFMAATRRQVKHIYFLTYQLYKARILKSLLEISCVFLASKNQTFARSPLANIEKSAVCIVASSTAVSSSYFL